VHLHLARLAEVVEEFEGFLVLHRIPVRRDVVEDLAVRRAHQGVLLGLDELLRADAVVEGLGRHRPIELGFFHHLHRLDVRIDLNSETVPGGLADPRHRGLTIHHFKLVTHDCFLRLRWTR
jgi:hypothetical protein